MKLKDLRQKYNGLLEKLIRLFTLSGVMFTVTACYGVAPFDTEEKDIVDVKGQIMDQMAECYFGRCFWYFYHSLQGDVWRTSR